MNGASTRSWTSLWPAAVAVPVLVAVLGLVVIGSAPRFHENHRTPSSPLEVKVIDRYWAIGELAKGTGVATSAWRYHEESA